MRKTVSILIAAALMAGATLNAFAINDNVYSAETETITEALNQMNDNERMEFVNENLDIKLQNMSTLVTLTANQNYEQIGKAVAKAIEDGLTAIEIKEAIYQSAPYCGYTRAIKSMDAADEALTDLGITLPSESRITSTEETRYADGLTVQRHIFGSQIGTITDDMSPGQKLQTLYLSGICFGDFYNRAGLSLNTREFLTFCTIATNGTCSSQVGSHTTGNLNVGHTKDMLIAELLLNEEYNGTEKTAQAISAVNSNENTPATGVTEPLQMEAISIAYTTDSQELEDIIEHYRTDDADGYIDANLDAQEQKLILDAVNAYIDGTAAVTSDNTTAQSLVDLALLGAQGGREADVPAAVTKALNAGNSREDLLAAMLLCTPYNGFPRTLNIMGAINAALTEIPQTENIVITMQINNPTMTVNGTEKEIDPGMGTTPVILNDRTLLPVRAVVEEIGGTVGWNEELQEVTLAYKEKEIKLTIDSLTAYLNNEEQTLDAAPTVINDRTMLPIRFIAESFGYDVTWNESTQTVTIKNSQE